MVLFYRNYYSLMLHLYYFESLKQLDGFFSLFGSQYKVLHDSCGDLFDVIFFLRCVCWDRWIVGLWSSLSMENIWIFSEFFYVWLSYLCKSLRIIHLVWPTRLVVLAMGEVHGFGFNLAVSLLSDRRSCKARIVLLPSRITRWGFYHIAWIYPSTSCHLA